MSDRQEEAGGADGHLARLILRQLCATLPTHSVPDVLLMVPALCHTPHGQNCTQSEPRESIQLLADVCLFAGKVDMEALVSIYQRQRRDLKEASSPADMNKLKRTLQNLWQVPSPPVTTLLTSALPA